MSKETEKPRFSFMIDLSKNITAAEDGSSTLPKKIQVLPIGTWDTEQYGPVSITKEFLGMLVDNFKKGLRNALPIDINHDRAAAAGWLDNPTVEDDGLYCDTSWTPLGNENLLGRIYRFFSPEWSEDYVDPQTGIHHGPVLIAGTLTNRPLLKELPALVAHEGDLTNKDGSVLLVVQKNINSPSNKNMTQELTEVLAKKAEDLTVADKAVIKANQAELSDAQKETYKEVIAEDHTQEELDKKAKEEADAAQELATADQASADAAAAEAAKAEEVKTAGEQLVTITAAEKTQMVADAQKGRQAMEILEAKEAEEKAQGFIMSEDGKTGRVLPKAKDALTKLLKSFSPAQTKYFSEVMEAVPASNFLGEIGKDAVETNVKTAFETKAQEIMTASEATGKKLTLGQAQLEAAEKHPDLYAAYEQSIKQGI